MQYSNSQSKLLTSTVVLAGSIVLSACGGGGGGGSTSQAGQVGDDVQIGLPQPIQGPALQGLTEENFVEVLAFAFSNVFFSFEGDTRFIDSSGPGGVFIIAGTVCESGSVDFEINMPGGLVAMTGDNASADYSNCVVEFLNGDRDLINGSFDGEITNLTGVGFGSPFSVGEVINYSNGYTIQTLIGDDPGGVVTIDGRLQLTVDNTVVTQTSTVAGPNFEFSVTTSDGRRLVYRNVTDSQEFLDAASNTFLTQSDFDFSLLTLITNGNFIVETIEPFFGIGSMVFVDEDFSENPIFRPTNGSLTATDDNGAVGTLVASTDGVNAELSLDADGDGIPELTQIVSYELLDRIAFNTDETGR